MGLYDVLRDRVLEMGMRIARIVSKPKYLYVLPIAFWLTGLNGVQFRRLLLLHHGKVGEYRGSPNSLPRHSGFDFA